MCQSNIKNSFLADLFFMSQRLSPFLSCVPFQPGETFASLFMRATSKGEMLVARQIFSYQTWHSRDDWTKKLIVRSGLSRWCERICMNISFYFGLAHYATKSRLWPFDGRARGEGRLNPLVNFLLMHKHLMGEAYDVLGECFRLFSKPARAWWLREAGRTVRKVRDDVKVPA